MQTLILDIEADNLLRDATKVWCIVGYLVEGNTFHIYVDKAEDLCYPKNTIIYTDIYNYLSFLEDKYIVGHNIIAYDLPLLNKLFSFSYKININNIADTIIMSRLFFPDRNGHALEDWGILLRMPKGDHKDFSKLSNDMLQYCIQDVNITNRVYDVLKEEAGDWDWSASLTLEYNMQHIQTKQELNGVLFDVEKAETLLTKIQGEIHEIEQKVIPAIPMTIKDLGEVRKPFLKSGEYSATTIKFLDDCKK